eukprot:gene21378-8143_t
MFGKWGKKDVIEKPTEVPTEVTPVTEPEWTDLAKMRLRFWDFSETEKRDWWALRTAHRLTTAWTGRLCEQSPCTEPVFPLPYLPYMTKRDNKAAIATLLSLLAIFGRGRFPSGSVDMHECLCGYPSDKQVNFYDSELLRDVSFHVNFQNHNSGNPLYIHSLDNQPEMDLMDAVRFK